MDIKSQEPSLAGPMRATGPSKADDRLHARGSRGRRDSNRSLPVELEIAADEGVFAGRLLAEIDNAPSDVSPLHAVLTAGLIGEERYYRALAERLGCS